MSTERIEKLMNRLDALDAGERRLGVRLADASRGDYSNELGALPFALEDVGVLTVCYKRVRQEITSATAELRRVVGV